MTTDEEKEFLKEVKNLMKKQKKIVVALSKI